MKLVKIIAGICLGLISSKGFAQLKLDAEVRPRFENRHGFKSLFPDNADAAAFVSQRTRLNTYYNSEKLILKISVQDIRTWGDVPTLNTTDNFGSSLHEAWGEILLNDKLSLKLGRQEISLDDQRIMGAVNWAQQARSHDAAIIKYKNNQFTAQLAIAHNQNGEQLIGNTYNVPKNYKSMQYVWLHKNWQDFSASFLFLNNGLQYIDADEVNNETRYSQTLGLHLNYKKDKMKYNSNLYYQMGKDIGDNEIKAYLASLNINYKNSEKWNASIGGEIISGNDDAIIKDGENTAFAPLYGTNHKFNGLMDYFYVGNHANNVGLVDTYINTTLKVNESSKLHMAFHNFAAAAELSASTSNQLGNEIDIVYSYRFDKDVIFKAGYSQLFPSEGMEILKNNFDENNNYFAWLMVVIKPNLLTF